ncbi:MAG: heparinase II/III family protein [Planctomycetota bacterium]|nr:heparinase II/III family protein [Planctomycetota bacterium]MDA1177238.1 heparinase II/III family protein [Planctomycetota bacterium]
MTLIRILKKAATASPHEWITRTRQKLYETQLGYSVRFGKSAYATDQHRQSLGLSSIEELTRWWKDQPTRSWLSPKTLSDSSSPPHGLDELAARTRQLQDGTLWLFSGTPWQFDQPNRWHRDASSDRESPPAFYGSIKYLDAARVGDSKYVWEPNRWGWVFPLGASYQTTHDNSCFHTFRDWASDWCVHNPYPIGINYCSALEQLFRAYAVRWSLELFRHPLTEPENAVLLDSLFRILWTSCRHVEWNLSWYFAPNTHLMGEAFLLYMVGTSLPAFRESARWRELGRRILLSEAGRQFHEDGTHKELSTCYHLYATDFYLHALWIAHQAGDNEPELEQAALKLAGRLRDLTPTSGFLPPLNDCDGGRLTWFAGKTLDARPTLLLSQQRWPNSFDSLKKWTCQGDHQWMTFAAAESAATTRRPTNTSPIPDTHHDSGIVTYQNEWGDYVLFRAGPFGYHDCPHSHDNQLETLIVLAGQNVLVDSGTGAYTQDISLRNQFRGACGKNTPLVFNCGPSEPADAFSWVRRTDAHLTDVHCSNGSWNASGHHSGFTNRHGFPIRIIRQVHAFAFGTVAILDEWDAANEIEVIIPWTLSPELQWANGGWQAPNGKFFHVFMETYCEDSPERESPTCKVTQGPYSRDYGWNESTHVVSIAPPPSRRGSCLTLFTRGEHPIRRDGAFTYCIPSPEGGFVLEWKPANANPIKIQPIGAMANR